MVISSNWKLSSTILETSWVNSGGDKANLASILLLFNYEILHTSASESIY